MTTRLTPSDWRTGLYECRAALMAFSRALKRIHERMDGAARYTTGEQPGGR